MTSELTDGQREVVLLLLNQGATAERERIIGFVNEISDVDTKEALLNKINGDSNDD